MRGEKPKKHILCAEASDVVQESFGAVLERINCEVTPVASANAAFEELSSGRLHFDLVLVGDMSKPFTAEELEPELSVIREARKLYPSIPILVFTSHNYPDRAFENGATAYTRKPVRGFDLVEFVSPYFSTGWT